MSADGSRVQPGVVHVKVASRVTTEGVGLCEIITKLGSPAQAKADEIFVSPLLPHPPSSALNLLPLANCRLESK